MTAEDLARALGGRRSGRGYVALCPAHEDRSPSLSIADQGEVMLVHCHAGCDQADVIAALRARGLWPERERREWTPAERRQWARERRAIERDLPEARYWRRAAGLLTGELLDVLKRGLFDRSMPQAAPGEIEYFEGFARELRRMPDAALVQEYRWWQQHQPKMTAALVRRACGRDQAERRALAKFIEQMEA